MWALFMYNTVNAIKYMEKKIGQCYMSNELQNSLLQAGTQFERKDWYIFIKAEDEKQFSLDNNKKLAITMKDLDEFQMLLSSSAFIK